MLERVEKVTCDIYLIILTLLWSGKSRLWRRIPGVPFLCECVLESVCDCVCLCFSPFTFWASEFIVWAIWGSLYHIALISTHISWDKADCHLECTVTVDWLFLSQLDSEQEMMRARARNPQDKVMYTLVSVPDGNDISSIFELDPTTLRGGDSLVPRYSEIVTSCDIFWLITLILNLSYFGLCLSETHMWGSGISAPIRGSTAPTSQ